MPDPAKLTADEALAQMAQNVVEYISAERPTVFCDHSRWHAALSSELAALRLRVKEPPYGLSEAHVADIAFAAGFVSSELPNLGHELRKIIGLVKP